MKEILKLVLVHGKLCNEVIIIVANNSGLVGMMVVTLLYDNCVVFMLQGMNIWERLRQAFETSSLRLT